MEWADNLTDSKMKESKWIEEVGERLEWAAKGTVEREFIFHYSK